MDNILNETTGLLAMASAIIVAVINHIISGLRSRAAEKRQTKLSYVEAQIRDLFGPLYAFSYSNQYIYEAYKQHHADIILALDSGQVLSGEQAKSWMLWTEKVFQPHNLKMRDIIYHSAHLFNSATMPEIVLKFLAHVESYEAIISTFDEEHLILSNQIVPYPEGFSDFISAEYVKVSNRYKYLGIGMR